jgi:hypothetical protein
MLVGIAGPLRFHCLQIPPKGNKIAQKAEGIWPTYSVITSFLIGGLLLTLLMDLLDGLSLAFVGDITGHLSIGLSAHLGIDDDRRFRERKRMGFRACLPLLLIWCLLLGVVCENWNGCGVGKLLFLLAAGGRCGESALTRPFEDSRRICQDSKVIHESDHQLEEA